MNACSSAQASAAASSTSSDAEGERRRVGGEPLRNFDAPRQQYLADHLRAASRAASRAAFRTAFRTAALVPLAPLRAEQRIVIRSGTFARTQ